jgi:hypothetical protein
MRIAALALVLTGCLTHMPLRTREHLSIHWATNWDPAVAEAQASNRPILMCLIAGEIDGPC